MESYNLSKEDLTKNYFHFTKLENLENIKLNGLIPKIGSHAKHLEVTKKAFFVEGLDNLLILLDCWLNVCESYPHIRGLYNIGTKIKGKNIFTKMVINIYFKWTKINKLHRFVAYKYFDRFLKRDILLNVDIKEGIDFSFDDDDQIKAKKYDKDFLIKAGYSPLYSDLETTKMDKWNLHTFSNHGIDVSKLKMCYIDESNKLIDILNYALNNTTLDLETICPVLWKYLKKRKYL